MSKSGDQRKDQGGGLDLSETVSKNHQKESKQPPRLLFKVLNPVMRGLLKSPLHGVVSGRLMLMHFTGRKTDKPYAVPVGYAQAGTTLYTGTEGRWARNLRGGADIEVSFKGKRRPATVDVISDVDGMMEAYRVIHGASPGYANALTRSGGVTFGPNGEVNRDEVERAGNAGHVVIRTTLNDVR